MPKLRIPNNIQWPTSSQHGAMPVSPQESLPTSHPFFVENDDGSRNLVHRQCFHATGNYCCLDSRAAHRPFDGDGRRLTAVNLQLKSQNGNGRVKNGRRRVGRPFAQPFDVYYFFDNFSFVFGYLVDEIRDIERE